MQYPPQQPYQSSQQPWPPPTQYPQSSPWQQPSQYPEQQWQQPYPPPQQPYYPPPMMQPPPKRKRRIWLWIVLGIILLGIIGFFSSHGSSQSSTTAIATTAPTSVSTASSAPTQVPTQVPTHTPGWKTIQTFHGNGNKKTAIFSVPDDWKIAYACTFQNIDGVTGVGELGVTVYGANNSIIDPAAVLATCKIGVKVTSGETEEHQGGQVYLNINGTGDWTVKIQVLQ
jgi:hypothetical protein